MIKSCKKLEKLITGFTWLIAGCFILPIIIMLIFSVLIIFQANGEKKAELGESWIQTMENINNKVDEFEQCLEEIEETKDNSFGIGVFRLVITILILGNLSKILKATIEKETPFSADSVKYMKKVDILACLNWIMTTPFIINIGLIYIFVISVITYIFEYGYQLQIEADEIL